MFAGDFGGKSSVMKNSLYRMSRRLQLAGAASMLAIMSASCASYADYDRSGYRDSDDRYASVYDRQEDRTGYHASGSSGIEAARDAHRRYSDYRAEQFDGDCERRVTIRYGETLSDLAEYCDVSVDSILYANPGTGNTRNISVGDQFYIPAEHAEIYKDDRSHDRRNFSNYRNSDSRYERSDGDRDYHIVRRGDTLADIAARYDVSLADVVSLNRDVRPRDLEIGDRIYLPDYSRFDQTRRGADREVSLSHRRPAVSFSPDRGPRNGEITLIGDNFSGGEQVAVLYGDSRERLSRIRTIEADRHGKINEVIRLPDAYESKEAYFAMQRGNDTYFSDRAYAVDYDGIGSRNISNNGYGSGPGLLQRPDASSSSAVLRALESEIYRDDTVSLSANGFPPNTPVAIYGGPNRNTLTKISEIRTGPSGLFQTDVQVPDNVDGEHVLFVAAVEDGARTVFTERVRVRSDDRDPHDRGRNSSGVSVIYPDDSDYGHGLASGGSKTLSRGVEGSNYNGRGFLSRFQRRGASDAIDINTGSQGAISGVLTNEGKRCPTLRDDAGNIFSLLGDLRGYGDGDRVLIRGSAAADKRICNQSETIQIFAIESAPW